MRARNIKPGFFKNELLGTCEPITAILFAGLWTLADREGRLEDRPLRIKAEIFPYRESLDINGSLTELVRFGFIERYEVSGCAVIQITNFHKHQTPHKTEKLSNLPKNNTTCSRTSLEQKITEPLPPDSLIPDSLIPDTPHAALPRNYFQICREYILEKFPLPSLEISDASPIYLWQTSGYDFEKHIRPVIDASAARGAKPGSFSYFTPAIANASEKKMPQAPKPEAKIELSAEEIAKRAEWKKQMGIHA